MGCCIHVQEQTMEPLNILVIDDDPREAVLVDMQMREMGLNARVIAAKTGDEGLHLLRSASIQPDLLVCDHQMPGMSGAEVIEELRRDERLSGIPVLWWSNASVM